MAKKNKKSDDDTENSSDVAVCDISDLYVSASSIMDFAPEEILKVSPVMDNVLGGGMIPGLYIFTGPPKVGKTSVALHAAANAQRMGYKAIYDNIEHRLQKMNLRTNGLDFAAMGVIQSEKGNILTGPMHLQRLEKLINLTEKHFFIVDSFSSLASKEEHEGEIGDKFRAPMSMVLSTFLKRVAAPIALNHHILLGITHGSLANVGAMPGQSTKFESGGNKLKFAVDGKVDFQFCQPWLAGESQIGQIIHVRCVTSPFGNNAIKAEALLRYDGCGLDIYSELIKMAGDFGLLKRGGAWYTLESGEKVQGLEKMRDILISNKELYNELNQKLRALLKLPEKS